MFRDGDRDKIAEGAGEHVARRIVGAPFMQRCPDPVGGRTMDLPLHNRRMDDITAIIHYCIIEKLRVEGVFVDFDNRYVQLRRVGERQVAVPPFKIRDLERRTVDMPAVESHSLSSSGSSALLTLTRLDMRQ